MSSSQDPPPEAKQPETVIDEEFHELQDYLESWDQFTQVQFRYLRKRVRVLAEAVAQQIVTPSNSTS